jgi:hypothetical protein
LRIPERYKYPDRIPIEDFSIFYSPGCWSYIPKGVLISASKYRSMLGAIGRTERLETEDR